MKWTLKQIKFIVQSAEFYIGGVILIKEETCSKDTKYQNGKAEETYDDTVEYLDNYFYNINEKSRCYESVFNTFIDKEIYDEDDYGETYDEDDYREEEDEETDEGEEGYNEENEDYMDEDYFKEILDEEIFMKVLRATVIKNMKEKVHKKLLKTVIPMNNFFRWMHWKLFKN